MPHSKTFEADEASENPSNSDESDSVRAVVQMYGSSAAYLNELSIKSGRSKTEIIERLLYIQSEEVTLSYLTSAPAKRKGRPKLTRFTTSEKPRPRSY